MSSGFVAVQTDAELDEYLRNSVHSANALVGSCQMGSDVQQGAVVDGQMRVHGTSNLRVIDASVIPTLPGQQHIVIGGAPSHASVCFEEYGRRSRVLEHGMCMDEKNGGGGGGGGVCVEFLQESVIASS